MNARAFAARGRWFTDGPDFVDVACAHCKHLVESVDSRGECDDCAGDELRAAVREVSTVDLAVALRLGALTFAGRRRPALQPQPQPQPSLPTPAVPDLTFPSPPKLPDVAEPDLDFPSPPDLGDEGSADLNGWCDALRAAAIDHMEQHLPWERSWTAADAATSEAA